MKKSDKKTILKTLCERLPYGVKVLHQSWNYEWDDEMSYVLTVTGIDTKGEIIQYDFNGEEETHSYGDPLDIDLPILRPMSTMTIEERDEISEICGYGIDIDDEGFYVRNGELISTIPYDKVSAVKDWLNARHFDYDDLIDRKLAVEDYNGVYKKDYVSKPC